MENTPKKVEWNGKITKKSKKEWIQFSDQRDLGYSYSDNFKKVVISSYDNDANIFDNIKLKITNVAVGEANANKAEIRFFQPETSRNCTVEVTQKPITDTCLKETTKTDGGYISLRLLTLGVIKEPLTSMGGSFNIIATAVSAYTVTETYVYCGTDIVASTKKRTETVEGVDVTNIVEWSVSPNSNNTINNGFLTYGANARKEQRYINVIASFKDSKNGVLSESMSYIQDGSKFVITPTKETFTYEVLTNVPNATVRFSNENPSSFKSVDVKAVSYGNNLFSAKISGDSEDFEGVTQMIGEVTTALPQGTSDDTTHFQISREKDKGFSERELIDGEWETISIDDIPCTGATFSVYIKCYKEGTEYYYDNNKRKLTMNVPSTILRKTKVKTFNVPYKLNLQSASLKSNGGPPLNTPMSASEFPFKMEANLNSSRARTEKIYWTVCDGKENGSFTTDVNQLGGCGTDPTTSYTMNITVYMEYVGGEYCQTWSKFSAATLNLETLDGQKKMAAKAVAPKYGGHGGTLDHFECYYITSSRHEECVSFTLEYPSSLEGRYVVPSSLVCYTTDGKYVYTDTKLQLFKLVNKKVVAQGSTSFKISHSSKNTDNCVLTLKNFKIEHNQ